MAITVVELAVKNPDIPSRSSERKYIIDSGAPSTVIPRSVVEYLNLKPSFSREFALADGRIVKRQIGRALISVEDCELAVPVVLGEEYDVAILGITTLLDLGLMLCPNHWTIYCNRLMLA